mgnify:CR=1 FL=1
MYAKKKPPIAGRLFFVIFLKIDYLWILTDTVTDTSAGGSNPWAYFVRRYAIRMPSTLTGTNGYLKIMVKLQGSIQGNAQKVIFLNQQ